MNFKKLITLGGILLIVLMLFTACGGNKQEVTNNEEKTIEYPEKPLKIVIMFPEGSGPDGWIRQVTSQMKNKHGFNFEATNDFSNSGANAHNTVWNAPHDGYTIFGTTENALGFGVYGLTKQTTKDWATYTVGHAHTIIAVSKDAKYKTLEDIVKAAKAAPGTLKLGITGEGTSFHLKAALLEKITGAKFKVVPVQGEDIGLKNSIISNEVDLAIAPTVVMKREIEEGKMVPVVSLDLIPYNAEGSIGWVESIVKTYPDAKKYLPIDAAISLYMPQDVPTEVQEKFGKAFEEVMNSPEMEDFHNKIGVQKLNLWGQTGKDYVLKMESNFAWLAKEIGLAKVDPETLGIQRP